MLKKYVDNRGHNLSCFGELSCFCPPQVWFEGSFAEYEQDLRRRAGGNEPKRPKFRPLPTV